MAQTTASFASCRRMRHAIKSDYGHHIMEDMMALQSLSNQQSINQNWVFHATACLHHDDTAVFNPNETQYCWHRTFPSHQLILCWLVVAFARLWRASRSCNRCNCTPTRDRKAWALSLLDNIIANSLLPAVPAPQNIQNDMKRSLKRWDSGRRCGWAAWGDNRVRRGVILWTISNCTTFLHGGRPTPSLDFKELVSQISQTFSKIQNYMLSSWILFIGS